MVLSLLEAVFDEDLVEMVGDGFRHGQLEGEGDGGVGVGFEDGRFDEVVVYDFRVEFLR